VTVDPERDTMDMLTEYLGGFDPRCDRAGRHEEQTEAAKAAFGVMSEKVEPDAGGFYLVNHTASVFLIDRDGRFQGTIAYGEAMDNAVAKIKRLIGDVVSASGSTSRSRRAGCCRAGRGRATPSCGARSPSTGRWQSSRTMLVRMAMRSAWQDPAAGYVSRAALKLIAGLDAARDRGCRQDLPRCWGVHRRVHPGAARAGREAVYAVDVGHGQLARALRATRVSSRWKGPTPAT
jgi:hypothetical protein